MERDVSAEVLATEKTDATEALSEVVGADCLRRKNGRVSEKRTIAA